MAAAEACSLDCALVWRAVVAWTACSRQVAVDKQEGLIEMECARGGMLHGAIWLFDHSKSVYHANME
jgi:hypothetical protein